jgi:cobalt-zinc-cadmium resistance protein CzcA
VRQILFAAGIALAVSILLTPVLISLFMRGKVEEKEVWLMKQAKRLYRPALEWTLGHARRVLIGAAAAVAAAVAVFPLLGSEFIPQLDEGSFAVQVLRLPSISLEESIQQASVMERRLMEEFPHEIADVVSKTGRAEIATDPMGVNISDVFVMLKPEDGWTKAETKEELEEKMAAVLDKIPGMVYSFSQPIELRVNELVAGVRSDLAVKIYGDDLDVLKRKADETVAAISRLEGATGFKAQQLAGLPQLQITVLPDQLARYGINAADVMRTVEAIGGAEATTVLEGQRRFALAVRFPEYARQNRGTVANLLVSAPGGERVPLGQLARIEEVQGPSDLSHENGTVALPPGYTVDFGGQFENLERGTRRLLLVVPLSLLLIFLLLFATFNSVRQAALVFTGIPLATVGGVFALLLRGMPFSISAGVGFIALFGIAVLNGVVMVTYINELRHQGHPLEQAVREGGMTRLRPVLMTALVAALGFVPMAISHGAGAEVQRPLATVVIGGLITATLLTLLVLPLLYLRFERSNAERTPEATVREELEPARV